jgi:hypothetical protein
MAFLLCCGGHRSHSPTLVPPDSERLRTLQPASFVSIALPPNTIPHRPTTGIDEHQALRDIFGASPTSHRGYQAAAKSSGSFDANFKFGQRSPSKSRTRPRRSLDKLGQNIRQRLSQSRLSNHSSRKSGKDIKSTETVIHTKLIPNSHASTGLDDLLVSRTVSEGGYDSDAGGIKTPSWTKASAGSVLVSPEYTAKVLNAFDVSPAKRSISVPRTPCKDNEKSPPQVKTSQTPSMITKDQRGLPEPERLEVGRLQTKFRAVSAPKNPATPQKDSFSALLQFRPQESPTDVLRRLSLGLAKGTIKLPDTPELRAMRMPSIADSMPEWRLSFTAPKRASSLHRGDPEVRQALKTLSDRVEKVKRDSAASGWTADDKHISLLSNLDPALLDYIHRFGDEEPDNRGHEAKEDGKVLATDGGALNDVPDQDTASQADTSGLHDSIPAQADQPKSNGDHSLEENIQHCDARRESEKESVHLFDMRISQRLASTSVLPTTSPSSTNLDSNQNNMDRSSQSFGKLDRFPTFIGQTSAEHLRRPSDPNTKRIFEPDRLVDGRKLLHPKWRSGTAMSSLNPEKHTHRAEVSRDDASSVYVSETGLDDTDVKSVVSHRTPSNPRPNQNSCAIAGRRGVRGTDVDQRRNSVGQIMRISNGNNAGLARSVSDAKAKKSKFSEDFDIHKRMTRSKFESEGANTLANESMSIVNFLTTTDLEVNRNERMSEIDFVEAVNKRLESGVRRPQNRRNGRNKNISEASHGSTSTCLVGGGNMTYLPSDHINHTNELTRTSPRGRDECATNMWERALRTAREDPSLESSGQSFGSSFGHFRRDHSHVRRSSDSHLPHEHKIGSTHNEPGRQSRSLSPRPSRSAQLQRQSFNLDRHQSLCVEAKRPLTRATSPARSIKATKESVLDIRRFTTVPRHNAETTRSTPVKDILAWARFPSHTRLDRNGAAAHRDAVSARDFSPPTCTDTSSRRNRSKLSLMTQPDNVGVHTPGSWKFLKFGHGRKKSRSMTFAESKVGPTEKEKAKKKSSMLTLTLSLAKWKRLYRSHSSDLRRFRAGHRSSISKGGKVEYPELEIVPGYDGGSCGRVKMEEIGDFEAECRKWEEQRGRETSNVGFDGPPDELDRRSVIRERLINTKLCEVDDGSDFWSGIQSSSLREPMDDQTPTKNGNKAAYEAGNSWANIYQACVVKDADTPNQTPVRGLLSSQDSMPTNYAGRRVSESHQGEDSYVSCSVQMSDDLPGSHRSVDAHVDGACDSVDRLLAGRERYDQKERMKRLVSSELRSSTADFRIQLQEEERRVREDLLRAVGGGEDGLCGLTVVA